MKRTRRILYATDFSAASRPALAVACEWARRDRARLLILHVLTPPSPFVGGGRPAPASYLDLLAAARHDAHRRLAALLARTRAAGIRVETKLVEGGPAVEIMKAAGRWHADVVVIGSHGRTGVSRFLLGSVAEQVVTRSVPPVLTVRSR
ncbi:MAG TPA: universal stress protein [Methylomirabilota bacterium]|nr:universal stress protein [Methylomirabilota bacterium]